MSWAEHLAADTAPHSKYGVKRWKQALEGLQDNEHRAEIAQLAISLDSPDLLNRYVSHA